MQEVDDGRMLRSKTFDVEWSNCLWVACSAQQQNVRNNHELISRTLVDVQRKHIRRSSSWKMTFRSRNPRTRPIWLFRKSLREPARRTRLDLDHGKLKELPRGRAIDAETCRSHRKPSPRCEELNVPSRRNLLSRLPRSPRQRDGSSPHQQIYTAPSALLPP